MRLSRDAKADACPLVLLHGDGDLPPEGGDALLHDVQADTAAGDLGDFVPELKPGRKSTLTSSRSDISAFPSRSFFSAALRRTFAKSMPLP
jgi:hypothetical protein